MTATNVTPLPELLLPRDAAKAISVSEIALARMRGRGTGPRFILVGRTCRYSRDALAEYLNSRTFSTVREARAAGARR